MKKTETKKNTILCFKKKIQLKIIFILIIFIFFTKKILNFMFIVDENIFKLKGFKVLFFFLIFIFIYFLGKTIFQDPGILPRSKYYNSIKFQKNITYFCKFKNIGVNDNKFQLKFCETCQIWRSQRTSHCSLCHYCIFLFDHHCPWIGTCIGHRNYKWFILFINILFWYLFLCSRIYLKQTLKIGLNLKKKNYIFFNNTISYYSNLFFILSFSSIVIIGVVFTGLLILFHFYLYIKGLTTSEIFKYTDKPLWSNNSKNETLIRFRFMNNKSLIKGNVTKKYLKFKINS